jgi:hypothetical protein
MTSLSAHGQDRAELKEARLTGSSKRPNDDMAIKMETEAGRRQSGSSMAEEDEVETEEPLQNVRTLGKLRFRPDDDDEPQ